MNSRRVTRSPRRRGRAASAACLGRAPWRGDWLDRPERRRLWGRTAALPLSRPARTCWHLLGKALPLLRRTSVSSRAGRRFARSQFGGRAARLRLAAALVQNPLGIAVRLSPSLEDQVAGGAEGSAVKLGRHGSIGRIARILPVDNLGHPPQRPRYLLLVDYAVMQPVGDVLA